MKLVILTLLLIFNISFNKCLGQNKKFTGTWTYEKVKVFSQELKSQELTENLDADTLKFTDTTFEEKVIVEDEKKNKFLWIQSGEYRIHKNKLILFNRISSEGIQGKEYPEIRYKYKFKNGLLILITANELNDTFWRYYKRIN